MSERVLDVYLDGHFSGMLEQSSSGNLSFVYAEAYRASGENTPLSLSMPLATARHRKRAVLSWLRGLLPDNPYALTALARRYGVSSNNPFALLEHVGRDAAGAVQIVRHGEQASDSLPQGSVRALSERELSRMLTQVVGEYAEGVASTAMTGRFSLAGAQPKVAVHQMADGGWGIPEDSTPTTHILKPVVGDFPGIDVVEYMTMRAAAYLGNTVAHTEIATVGAWTVLISERYDRQCNDGVWRLCTRKICVKR